MIDKELEQVKKFVQDYTAVASVSMELLTVVNGIEIYASASGATSAVTTMQRPKCNQIVPSGFNTHVDRYWF